ncbi:MAG: ethanolamine utilization microcompartment protein EutL [Anaerolineaceae bacterium]|jgi:ethanolamine utilization protein EutL|nr:ethanolamine utilization microcompartment protein EutL [Anaerolineaceae bacterium]
MAILDPIHAKPLAVRLISQVAPDYARVLGLTSDQRSLGILTADNDDATYVSIDEATKKANVEVVYAHSFFAGSRHASGPLSGEIIAMLAGPDPDEVRAGLEAALHYLTVRALWYAANQDGSIAFFPHVISQTGSYLSKVCGIPLGSPIAYLIAPPLEGVLALDAALKAAAVEIVSYTPPPSETNFMGAILTGDQSACQAAAMAFQDMVLDVARRPISY